VVIHFILCDINIPVAPVCYDYLLSNIAKDYTLYTLYSVTIMTSRRAEVWIAAPKSLMLTHCEWMSRQPD